MNSFDLKIGMLIKLNPLWVDHAFKARIKDDIIKTANTSVYKIEEISKYDDIIHVDLEIFSGADKSRRCLQLIANLEWYDPIWQFESLPMIVLAQSNEKIENVSQICEGYNSKCLLCGHDAYALAISVECSNSSCVNSRKGF